MVIVIHVGSPGTMVVHRVGSVSPSLPLSLGLPTPSDPTSTGRRRSDRVRSLRTQCLRVQDYPEKGTGPGVDVETECPPVRETKLK